MQVRLREEVMSVWEHRESAVPSLAQLESLPFLSAFIKEGLRIYGSAPAHLERVVPAEGLIVNGHYIPPGVSKILDPSD